jgi:hypothetical protein
MTLGWTLSTYANAVIPILYKPLFKKPWGAETVIITVNTFYFNSFNGDITISLYFDCFKLNVS